MLSYRAAQRLVADVLRERSGTARETGAGQTEVLQLAGDPAALLGWFLAEDIFADRDYPPFDKSIRDGFALQAADAASPGATLRLIGESRAGAPFEGKIQTGECVQIFTGAALPAGADCVVMQEYARAAHGEVQIERAASPGQHVVRAGSEIGAGARALQCGTRLGYAELALAAQSGKAELKLARKPRVAILSTGDEIVPAGAAAGPFEIRNTNGVSLAAQVALAGGEPVPLANARDRADEIREKISRGLEADILVIAGGVSVGKYDLAEGALRELGAEFFFDSIAVRPGKPAIFCWCAGKPVFGLPGNPISTMVTFELLVAPAIEILSGGHPGPLPLFQGRAGKDINEKPGISHFLPGRLTFGANGPVAEPLAWQGSGDIGAVARANCFLLIEEPRFEMRAGDFVNVLLRRGAF